MIVLDALPRVIDLRSTLAVDVDEVASETVSRLLSQNPELQFDRPSELESDCVRIAEMIALAITAERTDVACEYAAWLFSMRTARGLPAYAAEDMIRLAGEVLSEKTSKKYRAPIGRIIARALIDLHDVYVHTPLVPDDDVLGEVATRVLRALLRGDLATAEDAMEHGLENGLKVLDCYMGVLQPVLREIGRLWQVNRITAAQEHVASALVPGLMAFVRRRIKQTPPDRGTLFVTGVRGELHDLGLQIIRDVAVSEGWNTLLAGSNAPDAQVVALLHERPADIVGISVTMPHNIDAAKSLVQMIRSDATVRGSRIWVGGRSSHLGDSFWRTMDVQSIPGLDAVQFVAMISKN